ncbi:MAG TPA: SCP2 sterol-binding domain-containing protein [Solirubrobacterales bacterium]|nr:SCP2 sterol-binding domain-containing protein [Solirubrobacterales bacterium]
MDAADLENAEPMEIYAAVAEMDDDEFEAMMQDPPRRKLVIDALIDHMVGIFRPEQAGDLEASIHIKLWDRPGGGYEHYEMQIADGACELIDDPDADPDLTLKVRPTDLRKLITGESGARRMALKGRLRVIGDLGLGMKLPDLFDF